jgi:uncharacterized protein YegJ (DUF2314 family)
MKVNEALEYIKNSLDDMFWELVNDKYVLKPHLQDRFNTIKQALEKLDKIEVIVNKFDADKTKELIQDFDDRCEKFYGIDELYKEMYYQLDKTDTLQYKIKQILGGNQ